jgi:hypothetical protein
MLWQPSPYVSDRASARRRIRTRDIRHLDRNARYCRRYCALSRGTVIRRLSPDACGQSPEFASRTTWPVTRVRVGNHVGGHLGSRREQGARIDLQDGGFTLLDPPAPPRPPDRPTSVVPLPGSTRRRRPRLPGSTRRGGGTTRLDPPKSRRRYGGSSRVVGGRRRVDEGSQVKVGGSSRVVGGRRTPLCSVLSSAGRAGKKTWSTAAGAEPGSRALASWEFGSGAVGTGRLKYTGRGRPGPSGRRDVVPTDRWLSSDAVTARVLQAWRRAWVRRTTCRSVHPAGDGAAEARGLNGIGADTSREV